MENEIENRFQRKPVGWRKNSIAHRLAQKGIRTKINGNPKLDKAKQLSEKDMLTWGKFQEIFGDVSEEKLEQLVNDGKITLDADEVDDPSERVRYGETRLEVEESNGETKVVSLTDNTHLKIADAD